MTWRDDALALVQPTPEEDETIQAAAKQLVTDIQHRLDEEGWSGTPRLEGSLAKGTYLHGNVDLDTFIAFPPNLERETLIQRTHKLKPLLTDAKLAYAEHPYVQGTYNGYDAEIVPCYAVETPKELKSSVDRTPFHTEHVKQHLTTEGKQDVRLLKAFLKAAGCYGAKEEIRGISGYLAELLILTHQTFEDTLEWATHGFHHPITFDHDPQRTFTDPLIVIAPVDPNRNAAAAVRTPALERFQEAAAAFRQAPHARYFTTPPDPTMNAEDALRTCNARNSRILTISFPAIGYDIDDPIHAQLRRAITLATEQLTRQQVPVYATHTHLEPRQPNRQGWILIEADHQALKEPLRHGGPPAHLEEHATAFRERWTNDPMAASTVQEDDDGRLYVDVHRDDDTLGAIVLPHLEQASAGKIIDTALQEGTLTLLEDAEAITEAPSLTLGGLLDRRRPWQRSTPETLKSPHSAK